MTNTQEKCTIGMDVSKAQLDGFILPHEKPFSFENTAKGIRSLLVYVKDYNPERIVLEATGGYEKACTQSLLEAGFEVCLMNPRRIRDFAKASGLLAKTDSLDAKIIARFGKVMQPEPNAKQDAFQEKLVALESRRQQLLDMVVMEKNHVEQADKLAKASIKRLLRALEKELSRIEEQLAAHIESNNEAKAKQEQLCSIKGVGVKTATALLAFLPELGSLAPKKIAALVGLVPYNCDSGQWKGQRRISGGRASVRKALYMATLTAIVHNPAIKAFYQRLCQRGKAKMVALTACMHKLLRIANAIVRDKSQWRDTELGENN